MSEEQNQRLASKITETIMPEIQQLIEKARAEGRAEIVTLAVEPSEDEMPPMLTARALVERFTLAMASEEGISDSEMIALIEKHDAARDARIRAEALMEAADIRQEVSWFSLEMERKLKANDHKGGWRDCSMDYLFRRLREEMDELALAEGDDIIDEAADVANFAMMIADRLRDSSILAGEPKKEREAADVQPGDVVAYVFEDGEYTIEQDFSRHMINRWRCIPCNPVIILRRAEVERKVKEASQ